MCGGPQEEVEAGPPVVLSASASSIKVTEATQDGEVLTFIIVSQKVKGVFFIYILVSHSRHKPASSPAVGLCESGTGDCFLTLMGRLVSHSKLSGTGEYHVDRTYEDFEWLQQHLFSLENVPGIQGVIVSAFTSCASKSTEYYLAFLQCPIQMISICGVCITCVRGKDNRKKSFPAVC